MTGTLNDKTYVLHQPEAERSNSSGTVDGNTTHNQPHPMHKLFSAILCSPGPVVSFSLLLKNGLFKRHNINNCTKKSLMIKTAEEIALLDVGIINNYKIQGNNAKVFSILCIKYAKKP